MGKIKDLIGNKFCKLTVMSVSDKKSTSRGTRYTCKCDCGNTVDVRSSNLSNGHTRSCGCLQVQVISNICKNRITHGLINTSEYGVWNKMKQRCINSNNPAYKNYGGRGITVCNRWLNSFEDFYKDMGPRPSENHTIDRMNNNGNYEPENCYWATWIQQANNRRNNRIVFYNNTKYTIAQLSRKYNINSNLLNSRLYLGWSVEDAIKTAVK